MQYSASFDSAGYGHFDHGKDMRDSVSDIWGEEYWSKIKVVFQNLHWKRSCILILIQSKSMFPAEARQIRVQALYLPCSLIINPDILESLLSFVLAAASPLHIWLTLIYSYPIDLYLMWW